MNKRGQLISFLFALIITFAVVIFWLAGTRVLQPVDELVTPMIEDLNTSVGTQSVEMIVNIRKYNAVWPILIIASVWILALINMVTRDPNTRVRF